MKDMIKGCALVGLVGIPTLIITSAIGLAIVEGVANSLDTMGKKIKYVRNQYSKNNKA